MINKRLIREVPQVHNAIRGVVVLKWLNTLLLYSLSALLVHTLVRLFETGNVSIPPLFIPLVILKGSLPFLIERISHKISVEVKESFRSRMFEKLLRSNSHVKDCLSDSEWTQVSTEGIEQLENYYALYIPQFVSSLLVPVTLFVFLVRYHAGIATLLLVLVPLIPVSIMVVQRIAKRLLDKYWDQYTGLGDSFLENIRGLTTLKVFEMDEAAHVHMNQEAESFRNVTMRVLIMQLNSISIMDLVAYGGASLSVVLSLIALQSGTLSFAGFLMFVLLSSEFFLPMRLLGSYFHIAMNGISASEKMFKILDYTETQPVPSVSDALISDMGFELKNISVNFGSYTALKSVDMTLKKGEFIGLVGESGSGKSTLCSVFSGRQQVSEGIITFNGYDVSENIFNRNAIICDAHPHLFKGSVKDNITMGHPMDETVMVNALERMSLLELDLGSEVKERGSNLSGGQRQRLALARALAHDPDFFIFDEVTSNIDVESEAIIMHTIEMLAEKGRGILMVSHRIANCKNCSEICVLKEGSIIAKGTHGDLMVKSEHYSELVKTQESIESLAEDLGDNI